MPANSSQTTAEDPFALPGDPLAAEAGRETVIPHGGPTSGGKRVPIPPRKPFPRWNTTINTPLQDEYDFTDTDPDFTDLDEVNRDLQKLRAILNKARRYHREAERAAIEAQIAYKSALRRALVQQTGGSAETRKAKAELDCEELEVDYVVKNQVVNEWASRMRNIRDDIDNTKTVAYNLRTLTGL